HHPQLALQCQRQADPHGEAVDGGNERLLEIDVGRLAPAAPMEDRAVRILVRRALAFGLVLREELELPARAECLSGAGHDPAVDIRIEPDVAPTITKLHVRT